jgi:hypothetical protein
MVTVSLFLLNNYRETVTDAPAVISTPVTSTPAVVATPHVISTPISTPGPFQGGKLN